MNATNISELVLTTQDSLAILKQFIQKILSSHKEEFISLLVAVEQIDDLLTTSSKSYFSNDESFWNHWFNHLNEILDQVADLVTKNVKNHDESLENNYHDQIQECDLQLSQCIHDYEKHVQTGINDESEENNIEKKQKTNWINSIEHQGVQHNNAVYASARLPKKRAAYAAVAFPQCCCFPSRLKRSEQLGTSTKNNSANNSKPSLMISYNWDSQDICKKIYDQLKKDGYAVWFDVQNMHGCIYTAMATAVEKSEIIIFGMTEKYRNSDNCRKELTYACKRKKRMIPLRLQTKYDPDGWLGLISAELLYIDFTKNEFDVNYQSLLKEIELGNKNT